MINFFLNSSLLLGSNLRTLIFSHLYKIPFIFSSYPYFLPNEKIKHNFFISLKKHFPFLDNKTVSLWENLFFLNGLKGLNLIGQPLINIQQNKRTIFCSIINGENISITFNKLLIVEPSMINNHYRYFKNDFEYQDIIDEFEIIGELHYKKITSTNKKFIKLIIENGKLLSLYRLYDKRIQTDLYHETIFKLFLERDLNTKYNTNISLKHIKRKIVIKKNTKFKNTRLVNFVNLSETTLLKYLVKHYENSTF